MATPLDNQISISFTTQELSDVDAALDVLDKFAEKLIVLQPKQRAMYGKIGEDNEGFTIMIQDDVKVDSTLIPNFVDKAELQADTDARKVLMPRATRLAGINQKFTDTARVLSFDIYTAVLSIYNNAKFLASRGQGSAVTYYAKWKTHFLGGRPKNSSPKPDAEQKTP